MIRLSSKSDVLLVTLPGEATFTAPVPPARAWRVDLTCSATVDTSDRLQIFGVVANAYAKQDAGSVGTNRGGKSGPEAWASYTPAGTKVLPDATYAPLLRLQVSRELSYGWQVYTSSRLTTADDPLAILKQPPCVSRKQFLQLVEAMRRTLDVAPDAEVGQAVYTLRKATGLSLREFGVLVGLGASVVNRLETGQQQSMYMHRWGRLLQVAEAEHLPNVTRILQGVVLEERRKQREKQREEEW